MRTILTFVCFVSTLTLCATIRAIDDKVAMPMESLSEKVERSDIACVGRVAKAYSEEVPITQQMIDVVKGEKEFLISVLTRVGKAPWTELKTGQRYILVRYVLVVTEPLKGDIKQGENITVDYAIVEPKFFVKDEFEGRFKHLDGSRPDVFILHKPAGGLNHRPIFSGFATAVTTSQIADELVKLKRDLMKTAANQAPDTARKLADPQH